MSNFQYNFHNTKNEGVVATGTVIEEELTAYADSNGISRKVALEELVKIKEVVAECRNNK